MTYTKDNIQNLIFKHADILYLIVEVNEEGLIMGYPDKENAVKGGYEEGHTWNYVPINQAVRYLNNNTWKPIGYKDNVINNYSIF